MVKAKEPVAEQWYPLLLGSTCHDDATTRFYSLRYEFKPASIDINRPGTLHNSTENKVTVEFFNNQAGKPKVGFQGNSEECKELDAVLFFDGKSFTLERMHRAVKSLRHIRQPGESSAAAQGLNLKDNDPEEDVNVNGIEKISTSQIAEKSLKKPPVAPVQREKIESEEITPTPPKPDPPGKKKPTKKPPAEPKNKNKKAASPAAPASPAGRKREREPSPVNVDVEDEKEGESPAKKATPDEELEVEELVEELSEYEEVDISEDEGTVDQTAATLRAQAAEGAENAKASSSSSSSSSSGSGSGSSSSDSGSDDEDSASSADDGDDI
ncbi:hypothetical protein R1sor_017853 [Riccia sorocarpa]|uniref:Transcription elongation factor Eaf N-terminal domain-containing protein n=1 Tax=Riccia sorocarpa TaxID=122646 RepID=A0ABD3I8H4_9MARC